MATINFSVPEDLKQERRAAAIDALLDLRRRQQPVSDTKIAAARSVGRP